MVALILNGGVVASPQKLHRNKCTCTQGKCTSAQPKCTSVQGENSHSTFASSERCSKRQVWRYVSRRWSVSVLRWFTLFFIGVLDNWLCWFEVWLGSLGLIFNVSVDVSIDLSVISVSFDVSVSVRVRVNASISARVCVQVWCFNKDINDRLISKNIAQLICCLVSTFGMRSLGWRGTRLGSVVCV